MKKLSQNAIVSILSVLAVIIGVGGGYLFATRGQTAAGSGEAGTTSDGKDITAVVAEDPNAIKKGDVFGSNDETSFKDNAQGFLQIGGLDGEGSHALLRSGGPSQTVYLTSSVTDLDKFDGMEVKVWGETFKGQKAGWLMDVGRVEILDTKGTAPQE